MRINAAKIAIALALILLGIILAIISEIMQHLSKSVGTGFFQGLFLVDFTVWFFDGSEFWQMIFRRPSMPQYFAYWAVEVFSPIACTNFASVQGKRHRRIDSHIAVLSTVQILAAVALRFSGLAGDYQTLAVSHRRPAAGTLLTGVNLLRDFCSGRIRQYLTAAIGMITLLLTGVFEPVLFYGVRFYGIGIVSSRGRIFLPGLWFRAWRIRSTSPGSGKRNTAG